MDCEGTRGVICLPHATAVPFVQQLIIPIGNLIEGIYIPQVACDTTPPGLIVIHDFSAAEEVTFGAERGSGKTTSSRTFLQLRLRLLLASQSHYFSFFVGVP